MSFSFSPLKCVALLAAALVPAALTGCANMVTTDTTSSSPAATVSGTLHGGQQPISGATVTLWAAGTTGYGSLPTLFATTTSSVDGQGSFAFTQLASSSTVPTGIIDPAANVYSCPTTGNPQMYLVAKGGSTGGVGSPINSAAAFIIPVGPCSTAGSQYVTMNEVTTVATLAALQQFFNPAIEGFGYNSTAQSALGFSNALGTISVLANTSGGGVGANTTFTPVSSLASATVTATPESAKINTMANILAACINTTSNTSTGCTTLFTNAVPPATSAVTSQPGTKTNPTTYLAATDTLQAAYYMLVNPTDGGATALGNLFTLGGTGIVPFQPALTGAPSDWTIGITYASTSAQTVSGTSVGYLNVPEYLGVDAQGNIWITNFSSTASTNGLGNGMTELSPQGGITQQVLTGANLLVGPKTPVIDPKGNIWVPNTGFTAAASTVGYAKTVVEFPANGSSTAGNLYNVAGGPFALASDGAGNIFVAETTKAVTNTGGGDGTPGADIEEIPVNSTAGTTGTVVSPSGSGYSASTFASMAIDSNFNVWVTSDSTKLFVFEPGSPYTVLTGTGLTDTVGIGIDSANNAWVANYAAASSSKLDKFSISGGVLSSATPYSLSLQDAFFSTIDGAGNIWSSGHSTGGLGAVSESSNTGTLLSPSTASPNIGFNHTFDYPSGIAVDPSGNVWIGNEEAISGTGIAATGTGAGGAAAGGFVTEIVGAAVPVVTPIAAGLPTTAGGTSKLGTKP